ncbi:MAG: hypothetical protein M3Y36_08450, partial [Actinomycetota bacterium]|nr:hypothetical protein [Actinomycetota bacterium]
SEAVIRRCPPTPAQRRRRVLGALTVVVVTVGAVRGLGALDAGTSHRPGLTRGASRAGAAGSARGAGPAPGGPMGSPPRAATVTRTFFAAGGPVIAVVTEKGAPLCEVDLLDSAGALLAQGWAHGQPVTLHAVAVANAPLSLVLRPTSGVTLSWQADLSGASG